MARSSRSGLQVLTANLLGGGEVVYAGPAGWTADFREAEIFRTAGEADARLEAAGEDVRACRIVEPYLFGVEESEGRIRPASMREDIRARGPSIL